MLGTLNDTQISNVLSSQALGRLACTDGSQPYIVPLTYAFDGKYIYGQTSKGMKMDILRKNPKVCFEVDMMTDMAHWQSVLVFGRFEELKTKKAIEEARELLSRKVFSIMTSSTIHPHEHSVNGEADNGNRLKPVLYRIKIKKMTGRFETQ